MCEDDLGPSYEWGGTEKYQDVWYGVEGPPENGVNVCFLAECRLVRWTDAFVRCRWRGSLSG